MADYLERAYWGPNADSRLGPRGDDDCSILAKPHCMSRPDEKQYWSASDFAPEELASAQDDAFSKAKMAGGLLLGGLVAAGLLWAIQKALDPKGPRPD